MGLFKALESATGHRGIHVAKWRAVLYIACIPNTNLSWVRIIGGQTRISGMSSITTLVDVDTVAHLPIGITRLNDDKKKKTNYYMGQIITLQHKWKRKEESCYKEFHLQYILESHLQ